MNPLVSVIIPTFNRFTYLLNAIESVRLQTYSNIELIVINDGSTQEEYYKYDFDKIKNDFKSNFKIIHLDMNTRKIFNFPASGYVRNIGISISKGEYIALLDDDDIWMPEKVLLQINEMLKYNCEFSCTEGYIGNGVYSKEMIYSKYNLEYYYNIIVKIYQNKNSNLMDEGYPQLWNLNFLSIHNCCINSSIMYKKSLFYKVGCYNILPRDEDYDLTLRLLTISDCIYINIPLVYYDNNHGDFSFFNN